MSEAERPAGSRPGFAWLPVAGIAGAVLAALLALANRYGFHRDELYFVVAGRHPDWGYIDQPPLTPLLSAAAVELFGLSAFALRIVPAICAAAIVVLGAAIAREFGGDRRAQVVAAVVVAGSWILGLGHLDSTATYDALVWTVVAWLLARILAGGDQRLWLAVGAAVGIGLQNKHLVLLLVFGLAVGVVVSRRWWLLRSGWLWAGMALAVLIWLPNLIWQAANGFPQLEMAGVVADRSAVGDVVLVVPFQLILAGPLLSPVLLIGLWWLLRSPAGRPWRPVGWAYLTILVLTIVTRGQFYYPAGLFPAILAAGAIPIAGWLRGRLRVAAGAGLAIVSIASMALVTLPLLPPATLAESPIPELYQESGEQIGWPELVHTVEGVIGTLSPADRDRAAILTLNYGEAGALTLLGRDLPPVYSGHNSFADWGPPADDDDLAVLVGHRNPSLFGACEHHATIDNPAGIENEEQGAGVWLCPRLPEPWSELWPAVRHLG